MPDATEPNISDAMFLQQVKEKLNALNEALREASRREIYFEISQRHGWFCIDKAERRTPLLRVPADLRPEPFRRGQPATLG